MVVCEPAASGGFPTDRERTSMAGARITHPLAITADPAALADLDADALVDLLAHAEQGTRAMTAAPYRLLSALSGHPVYQRGPLHDAAIEVACALRISGPSAQQQLAAA